MFTFHIALAAYVNSSFMSEHIPSKYVGLLYTTASLITLIIFANSSYVLRKLGNKKFVLSLLIVNIITLLQLIFTHNPYIKALSFVFFLSSNVLFMFSMDIFIEHFIDRKKEASSHGGYLSIINIAWVISPLLTASIITNSQNYILLYKISLIITLIMSVFLIFSIRDFRDTVYKKISLLKSLSYLKKARHIKSIVILNFLLQVFFSIMVVYTPLYLKNYMNFDWSQIGIIFTFMLLPFVIFGGLIGKMVEKYNIQKRKLLSIGFFIMIISVAIIPHLDANIAVWAFVLFMTRVGASITQASAEIYFFTHVHEEDAYLLGIYRDMDPLGYLVGPLLASFFILLFPFVYTFFILSLILMLAFYFIPHLKHNHEYTLPTTNQ